MTLSVAARVALLVGVSATTIVATLPAQTSFASTPPPMGIDTTTFDRSVRAQDDFLPDFERLGVDGPISVYVSADARDPTRYVAYASQAGLGMPDRDYYLSDDPKLVSTRDAYRAYAAALLRRAEVTDPVAAADRILEFETTLARHQWDRTRNRDREATYNAFDSAELGDLTAGFSWSEHLSALDVAETPIVAVRQPDYFRALGETLGENIGDLSGLAVAYDAYRHSLDGREAPVIGGLTGDQRFFLGWAQIWRTLYRDEALRQRLLTDSHSPGEFRVNGVLRNLDEFHTAFDVQPGDGMYLAPEERVKIW